MEKNLQPKFDLEAIRDVSGSSPISWKSIEGGYTTAKRWVIQLENGTSVFAKAAEDDLAAGWLRDEAKVYQSIHGDFMPRFLGWKDGEMPVLFLEDLSNADWSWEWSDEHVKQILAILDQVAATKMPQDFPSLDAFGSKMNGWRTLATNSELAAGFINLGLASEEWLKQALPKLVNAESNASYKGGSLVHMDMRSDNICFRDKKPVLIDWNWAARGNAKVDLISLLPSMHSEGGPAPWDITLDEPELIAAVTGYFAMNAPRPPHKLGPKIRELQLRQLRSALPWTAKALNLPPLD